MKTDAAGRVVCPLNTAIVSGDVGLDKLFEVVHEHWDRAEDYCIIWHLPDYHPDDSLPKDSDCDCPKIVFTRNPVPKEWYGSSH